MKITVKEVYEMNHSFIYLGNINDLFCSYEIAENIETIKPHIEKFNNDKKKLIDKYVLKNKDGSYKTTGENGDQNDFGENFEQLEKEAIKMASREIEIDICTIKKEELKDGKGVAINPPANILLPLLNKFIIK